MATFPSDAEAASASKTATCSPAVHPPASPPRFLAPVFVQTRQLTAGEGDALTWGRRGRPHPVQFRDCLDSISAISDWIYQIQITGRGDFRGHHDPHDGEETPR